MRAQREGKGQDVRDRVGFLHLGPSLHLRAAAYVLWVSVLEAASCSQSPLELDTQFVFWSTQFVEVSLLKGDRIDMQDVPRIFRSPLLERAISWLELRVGTRDVASEPRVSFSLKSCERNTSSITRISLGAAPSSGVLPEAVVVSCCGLMKGGAGLVRAQMQVEENVFGEPVVVAELHKNLSWLAAWASYIGTFEYRPSLWRSGGQRVLF